MTESQQQPIEMPKFELSALSFATDEEMDAEDATKGGSTDKYFRNPGLYDLVITQVEYKGQSQKDPTWVQLRLHLEGTDGKTITSFIQVPTKDIKYGPKGTTYVFRQLQDFCRGLGVDLKVANVKDTVKKHFARPEKLVGKSLKANVGWPEKKGYVKWAGKNATTGASVYNLMDQQHQPVRNESGIVEFPDVASAKLYAQEQMVVVENFIQVLSYASAVGKTVESNDYF